MPRGGAEGTVEGASDLVEVFTGDPTVSEAGEVWFAAEASGVVDKEAKGG